MNEGTWTIEPCERDAVATLARELSLSPTTAAVLVRRGYEDVAGARPRDRSQPPPPPGRDAPRVPPRRAVPRVRVPVRGALRHRSRLQARPGSPRRRLGGVAAASRPGWNRDDRRRRSARG